MATFVMIHGAWHGGWCFDDVRPLLEGAGHKLVAPDLPGMGGNDAELASTTLAQWAAFTVGHCQAADERPVILCGHSRGGIVISAAAELAPGSVDALVYISAMLLPNGLSRVEWKALAEPNPGFEAIIQPHPCGAATVINADDAPSIFAQLSPPERARAAAARLRAEPAGPRATPLCLSEARFGSVPRHYIECLADRTIPISDQRRMQAMLPCASVQSIDTDHSPFLSAPTELTRALIAIAEGTMQ